VDVLESPHAGWFVVQKRDPALLRPGVVTGGLHDRDPFFILLAYVEALATCFDNKALRRYRSAGSVATYGLR
jgi:hypothetical protein